MRYGYAAAIAFVCSLVTWALVSAQVVPPRQVTGDVITGADFGFRLAEVRGGRAIGQVVVRVDGRWIEAEASPQVRPVR